MHSSVCCVSFTAAAVVLVFAVYRLARNRPNTSPSRPRVLTKPLERESLCQSKEEASTPLPLRSTVVVDDDDECASLQRATLPTPMATLDLLLVVPLTSLQKRAFDVLEAKAAQQSAAAMVSLTKKLFELGFSQEHLQPCLAFVRDRLKLIIHFPVLHVLERLLRDTHYRSQFETGTSRGSLCRDSRRLWESRMFGGRYNSASNAERVKYGTVMLDESRGNTLKWQFGVSFLVLRDETMRQRTSLCQHDSSDATSEMGTLAHCAHVLAACRSKDLGGLLRLSQMAAPETARATPDKGGRWECQYHGDVVLNRDVAALVVSPWDVAAAKELKLDITDLAQRFASKFGCALIWAIS